MADSVENNSNGVVDVADKGVSTSVKRSLSGEPKRKRAKESEELASSPSTIKVGETIPTGVFRYIPYSDELADLSVCGFESSISTNSWKGKKVVIIGVPGAFTRTCSTNHLPGFIKLADQFKSKGVDQIYCLASNDLFVMSGWGRVNKTGYAIEMISDQDLKWSISAGLMRVHETLGPRVGRFAMVVDDLKVTMIEIEDKLGDVLKSSGSKPNLRKMHSYQWFFPASRSTSVIFVESHLPTRSTFSTPWASTFLTGQGYLRIGKIWTATRRWIPKV